MAFKDAWTTSVTSVAGPCQRWTTLAGAAVHVDVDGSVDGFFLVNKINELVVVVQTLWGKSCVGGEVVDLVGVAGITFHPFRVWSGFMWGWFFELTNGDDVGRHYFVFLFFLP